MRKATVAAMLALGGVLTGCTDTHEENNVIGSVDSRSGRIVINDDGQPVTKSGDVADSLELEGFDGNGNLIYGPVTVNLQPTMTFENVPRSLAYVQLDYLRNHGFLLLRAEVDTRGRILSALEASELPVDPHKTVWKIVPGANGFGLQRTLSGPPVELGLIPAKRAKAFDLGTKLRGVCYSPAPINFSNKDAPAVGDLFWDTISGTGFQVFNWYSLWGNQPLLPTKFVARKDLDTIRGLNCNCIRIYSGIARQLGVNGEVPAPASGQLFEHKQFLDLCWNNGQNPIYVLVDIPMADACLRKDVPDLPAGTIAFWESNLRESVRQMKDHPAVIGFNIMNEKDADPATFPNGGQGDPNVLTEYFYSQAAKYAQIVKEEAPDKLCGWALHDAPAFVKFASVKPVGNTYMSQLKKAGFDYWGINSYQTLSLSSILGNEDGSYANVPADAKLPVLFTELGWPATGHQGNSLDTLAIYEDASTHNNTAKTLLNMYPQALNSDMVLGTFYFEFQDEWWKQENPNDARVNKYTWNGTNTANPGFPNGFWDEEGFGLFSAAPTGRAPDGPIFSGSGPILPVDTLTERTQITDALRKVYLDNQQGK